MTKEVYLLVLDAVLMVLVAGVFLWKFPGTVLVGYKEISRLGTSAGVTDEESLGRDGIQMKPGGGRQQIVAQPYEPYRER